MYTIPFIIIIMYTIPYILYTLYCIGFFAKKYKDKNVRVYRTIPLYFDKPPSPTANNNNNSDRKWPINVNYSARSKYDINIDALPLKNGPYLGVVLYRPWDIHINKLKTGSDSKQFFESIFPMFTPFIKDEDYELFARKKDSKLPVFSYVGPFLHK